MNILLYGNCQLWGIKAVMFNGSNTDYNVEYLDCFLQDNDEMFMINKYKNADVIITQPINDNYRDKHYLSTSYIIKNCKNTCKIIIIDSLYFSFYYCDLTYTFFKNEMLPVPEHYHHQYIIDCYKNNVSVNDCINQYINNIDLLSKKELENKADDSIKELKNRYEENKIKYNQENVYFVYTGNYIRDNYKDKLLFYSMNHPTYHLLKFVSEQIVSILEFKNINYTFYEIDNAKCIIYKCIQKVVNFNIEECQLKIQDRHSGEIKSTIEDICKLYYDTYDRINFV
tara:strand:+ start:212 stop:1063 length:852 start_codon:yes stop_codon:yes gene_type:complete